MCVIMIVCTFGHALASAIGLDLLLAQERKQVFYANACVHMRPISPLIVVKYLPSEVWLYRRGNYTRSLAVMSMVGYILGLGDRHPNNLMLDRLSGKIMHIDFGDCFEVNNCVWFSCTSFVRCTSTPAHKHIDMHTHTHTHTHAHTSTQAHMHTHARTSADFLEVITFCTHWYYC